MNFDLEPGLVKGAFLGSERKQLQFLDAAAAASIRCRFAADKPTSPFISIRIGDNTKTGAGWRTGCSGSLDQVIRGKGENEGRFASNSVPVRKVR